MNQKAKYIVQKLDEVIPNPVCELKYQNTYQLLVAVVLSAQCTDRQVNAVTQKLFEEINTPTDMLILSQSQLERKIYSCGFYHNKAKNLLKMSQDLVDRFGGVVPNNLNDLTTLAGVGRKTANVVISEGFGGYGFAVDTHVLRICNRLNIKNTKNAVIAEFALKKFFSQDLWSRLHYQMVLFGRYFCHSQNPKCKDCPFAKFCEYQKNLKNSTKN